MYCFIIIIKARDGGKCSNFFSAKYSGNKFASKLGIREVPSFRQPFSYALSLSDREVFPLCEIVAWECPITSPFFRCFGPQQIVTLIEESGKVSFQTGKPTRDKISDLQSVFFRGAHMWLETRPSFIVHREGICMWSTSQGETRVDDGETLAIRHSEIRASFGKIFRSEKKNPWIAKSHKK